jgi:hypothetical protein
VSGEPVERLRRVGVGDERLEALGQGRDEQGAVKIPGERKRRPDRVDGVDRDELAAILLEIRHGRLGHRLELPGELASRVAGAPGDPAFLAGVARQEGDDPVFSPQGIRRKMKASADWWRTR